MSLRKLGPHAINTTTGGLAWAVRAPIVKQMGSVALFNAAPPDAVRIYRRFFPDQSLDADPRAVADAVLGGLGGYRHPNLHVEVYNEIPGSAWREYLALLQEVVPLLHAAGVKVCGPSWATGDYEAEAWEGFRAAGWAGLDLTALHAYWSTAGPTIWNGLRWRQFWRPVDPDIVVTECGRDQVRDGPNSTLLPREGPGDYGWQAQGLDAMAFVAELAAYDAELQKDFYVLGATPFTFGPTDDWKRKGFDCDPLGEELAAMTETRPEPDEEAPVTIKGIDVSNHQGAIDWPAVAASGVRFAFIKATEDGGYFDPFFLGNWYGARDAGLERGAYCFARPSTTSPADSVTQFEKAIKGAGGLQPDDLIALDVEDENVPEGQSLHVWVAEWLDLAVRVFGVKPFKYSGRWYTSTRDLEHDDLSVYPTWWASYQPNQPAPVTGWQPILCWQYSASGRVPGIAGDVDLDVFNGAVDELRALGLQGAVEPPAPPAPDRLTAALAALDAAVAEVKQAIKEAA